LIHPSIAQSGINFYLFQFTDIFVLLRSSKGTTEFSDKVCDIIPYPDFFTLNNIDCSK